MSFRPESSAFLLTAEKSSSQGVRFLGSIPKTSFGISLELTVEVVR